MERIPGAVVTKPSSKLPQTPGLETRPGIEILVKSAILPRSTEKCRNLDYQNRE